jgi:hypothetical protein
MQVMETRLLLERARLDPDNKVTAARAVLCGAASDGAASAARRWFRSTR